MNHDLTWYENVLDLEAEKSRLISKITELQTALGKAQDEIQANKKTSETWQEMCRSAEMDYKNLVDFLDGNPPDDYRLHVKVTAERFLENTVPKTSFVNEYDLYLMADLQARLLIEESKTKETAKKLKERDALVERLLNEREVTLNYICATQKVVDIPSKVKKYIEQWTFDKNWPA